MLQEKASQQAQSFGKRIVQSLFFEEQLCLLYPRK
jgi:hypothetical protein